MEKHDKDKDFLIQDSTEEFETTDLDSNDEFTLEEEDFDEVPAEDIVIQPQEDKDDEDDDEDDDDDEEDNDDEDQESSDTEDEISMQYYMDDEPGKPEFKKSNKEDDEEDDEEDDDEDEYISFSGSEEKPKTPQKSSKGTRILSFEDFVDGLDED